MLSLLYAYISKYIHSIVKLQPDIVQIIVDKIDQEWDLNIQPPTYLIAND